MNVMFIMVALLATNVHVIGFPVTITPSVVTLQNSYAITVTGGGVPPYTYSWWNEDTNSTEWMLMPDQLQPSFGGPGMVTSYFSVTLTDSIGNTGVGYVTVDELRVTNDIPMPLDFCEPMPLGIVVHGGIAPITTNFWLSLNPPGASLVGDTLILDLEETWDGGPGSGLFINATDSLGVTHLYQYGFGSWAPQEWGWDCDAGLVYRNCSLGYVTVNPQAIALTVVDTCGRSMAAPPSPCPTTVTTVGTSTTSTTVTTTTTNVVNVTGEPLVHVYNGSSLDVVIVVITDRLEEITPNGTVVQTCNFTGLNWVHEIFGDAVISTARYLDAELLVNTTFIGGESQETKYSYAIQGWPFLSRENTLSLITVYTGVGEFEFVNAKLKTAYYSVEFAENATIDRVDAPVTVEITRGDAFIVSRVIFPYFDETMKYDPLFSLLLSHDESSTEFGWREIIAGAVAGTVIVAVIAMSYPKWGHLLLLGPESWRVNKLRKNPIPLDMDVERTETATSVKRTETEVKWTETGTAVEVEEV